MSGFWTFANANPELTFFCLVAVCVGLVHTVRALRGLK